MNRRNQIRTRQRVTKALIALLCSTVAITGCSTFPRVSMQDLKPSNLLPKPKESSVSFAKLKPFKDDQQGELSLQAANKLADQGHWEEAIQLYEQVEALEPKSKLLDRELSRCYASAGQHSQAIERYHRLIQNEPKELSHRINLAWTLMESGNTAEAEKLLREVLERDPQHKVALSNLAVVLAATGRSNEAFEMFRASVGESAAHHNMGVVFVELGELQLARQAFETAQRMPNARPESAQFLKALSDQQARASVASAASATSSVAASHRMASTGGR